MITATLHEAKAKLHKLVEAARSGEQVVLMKGSEIVASIQPLSPDQLEIAPHLTDQQAQNFWAEVGNASTTFSSPGKAVDHLKKISGCK